MSSFPPNRARWSPANRAVTPHACSVRTQKLVSWHHRFHFHTPWMIRQNPAFQLWWLEPLSDATATAVFRSVRPYRIHPCRRAATNGRGHGAAPIATALDCASADCGHFGDSAEEIALRELTPFAQQRTEQPLALQFAGLFRAETSALLQQSIDDAGPSSPAIRHAEPTENFWRYADPKTGRPAKCAYVNTRHPNVSQRRPCKLTSNKIA